MRQFYVDAAATDVSVRIRIANTDGTPKTDVTATTPGLALSYIRQGAARVLIGDSSAGLTNLTALSDAHLDGGILHDVGGNYRFDIPDAAVAGGVAWVEIEGVVGDGVVFGAQVHIQNALPEVNTVQHDGQAVELSSDGRLRVDAAEVNDDPAAAIALATNIANLDATVSSRATPTTAADAVWDEDLAGHQGAGSAGLALSSAGSAGDPWNTLVPGAYPLGSAGQILGDNLDAAVTSRASQTSVDTVDNLVDGLVADVGTPGNLGSGATLADNMVDIEVQTSAAQTDVTAIRDNLPSAVERNAPINNFRFFMEDASGDPVTGLTVTALRAIDGGSFGTAANAVTEVSGGWYSINIAAADHNGDVIAWQFSASGARTRTFTILTKAAA